MRFFTLTTSSSVTNETPSRPSVAATERDATLRSRWNHIEAFLFRASSDQWLTILRIGLGIEVILYAWSLGKDWTVLFASHGNGLISRDLGEVLLDVEGGPLVPRLGWLVEAGAKIGWSETTVLTMAWVILAIAGCFLIVGFFSRSSAALAWFLHLCAAKSVGSFSYGMDNFTTIGLFYLMLSPLPDRAALECRFSKTRRQNPEWLGFFRRVLQIHLCFIYFFGGLTKILGAGWWSGTSLWRALMRPPFNLVPPEILLRCRFLLPPLAITILILETCYPLFIWKHKTRVPWLLCICVMHLAIGLTMGLYLFSLVMIVLNVAAFAPDLGLLSRKKRLALAGV